LAHKRKEVEERKSLYPIKLLEKSIYFPGKCVSLRKYVTRPDKSGIIAEIKRKSPSKGSINPYISVERTSIGYMQAGASALSILTDSQYFGGSNEDLTMARKFNFCPILRKEFIIDEYQVIESKSIGADAILLIAAAMKQGDVESLCTLAHSLNLEVLLEVHDKEEVRHVTGVKADLVGVNNRNLKTLKVDVNTSKELAPLIDNEVKVAESGIDDPNTILELRKYGYKGFLIGQTFMQHSRPEIAAMNFIKTLKAGAREYE
jgi:indole-3-glycerol phosphate synthase